MISLVFIVLNVREGSESKYPSIVFLSIFSNPSVLTYLLCAQKNRLIEAVLLSITTYVLVKK